MLKHALFLSIFCTIAFGVWLAKQVGPTLWGYHTYLFHLYGGTAMVYAALFLATLTCSSMLVMRYVWLKDTGSKLQHATKELREGRTANTPDALFALMKAKK